MGRVYGWLLVMTLVAVFGFTAMAQEGESSAKVAKPSEQEAPASAPRTEETEPAPIVTHHEIRVAGKLLRYTTTVGRLPIRSADGEIEAQMFFMAYTLDAAPGNARRPLLFSFNGGPGSASVWLHLGALGPKRVKMQAEGYMPAPPFRLVENEYTWLEFTDIVFIDPVGTGYSRPVKKELGKKFWNVKGDIESVGEFMRLYLTRYERWDSPLFMVGESYGTYRAAGLAGYLVEKGIAFNGIILVSSFLNFEALNSSRGNENGYILFLPTFTATAWYHKKLPPDLQKDLHQTLAQVEQWALTDYAAALAKGDRLSPQERQAMIDRLSRFTGLDQNFIANSNLRISQPEFTAQLLRNDRKTVGRLDGRFTGQSFSGTAQTPEYDPSMAAIRPPYTAEFANYVRQELGYKSDMEYYILGGGITGWDMGQNTANADDALRGAFIKNPYMRLFVASGYYDMATPYFASRFNLDHLDLDPEIRAHISTGYYEAGHMMYIQSDSLAKLKQDVAKFVADATK